MPPPRPASEGVVPWCGGGHLRRTGAIEPDHRTRHLEVRHTVRCPHSTKTPSGISRGEIHRCLCHLLPLSMGRIGEGAAKQCLKLPLHSLIHSDATRHLMHISAHLYQSLFIYHDKCGVAASSAGALLPWSDAGWVWIKCTTCPAYSLQCGVPGLTGRRTPRAWIFDYVDRASAVLKERPGASVFDLAFLAPTQAKAAACRGDCASSGFKDLATFILEKYVPKVNAAVDAVSLELHF
ncbi:hypothetical protein B0H10DRAFT_902335 [Mycena sp. CBHHK59/15]|nr:hypothetical protein B0H10DRAFT_902335 [Mycena sp. CBHHK59/15]